MKKYIIFFLASALIYLPVSPFLANFGLNVCPLLNKKGFWFGCHLNIRFVLFLLCTTSVIGIFLQTKIIRSFFFNLLKQYGTTTLTILFQILSLSALVYARMNLEHTVGNTTDMAFAVSAALWMVGIALISFQSILFDQLISLRNREDFLIIKASKTAVLATEVFILIQQIVIPILVMGLYLRLSLELSDTEVLGWDNIATQTQKLKIASAMIFTWYACLSGVIAWGRRLLVNDMSQQANALMHENSIPIRTVEKLGMLEPLGLALNKAAQILDQKRKLSNGFAKFVSDRMLENILEKNQLGLFGQKVRAGILMMDLRDFTSISHNLEPHQVVRLLNIYFEDMIEVLSRHSITVDKFIGDGLLAYLPCEATWTEQKISSELLTASHEILSNMENTNRKLMHEGLPSVRIGIGLHIGDVILGAIGSAQKMQYTIIGDAVNLSSRLESLCKQLKSSCVASIEFMQALSENEKSHLSGPHLVEVKGVTEKIPVYCLIQNVSISSIPAKKAA